MGPQWSPGGLASRRSVLNRLGGWPKGLGRVGIGDDQKLQRKMQQFGRSIMMKHVLAVLCAYYGLVSKDSSSKSIYDVIFPR